MIINQVKILLLGILGLLRRAMCCFSRRRKSSYSDSDSDRLQVINVIVGDNGTTTKQKFNNQFPERDWNSWDDAPRTVEEHIEQYRQQIIKPSVPNKDEPEPDFFSEMAPEIKPQLKYYLGPDTQQVKDFSRLEAKSDVPIALNPDLEDWADEVPGGWEELDSETTKQLIREKRKELRNQRQIASKSIKNEGIDQPSPRHATIISTPMPLI